MTNDGFIVSYKNYSCILLPISGSSTVNTTLKEFMFE